MSGLKFPKEETKKKRMSHPASILGSRKGRCYLCSRCGQTQEHHIFGGPNRTLSEKYGLKVYLCLECHATGKHAVHRDKAVMDELHRQHLRSSLEAERCLCRYSAETICNRYFRR